MKAFVYILKDEKGRFYIGSTNDLERRMIELSPDRLKKSCDPGQFAFETTKEVAPLDGTIGQDRAVSAIDFGFGIKTRGFNVYVAGPVGTGKDTTVRTYVQKVA